MFAPVFSFWFAGCSLVFNRLFLGFRVRLLVLLAMVPVVGACGGLGVAIVFVGLIVVSGLWGGLLLWLVVLRGVRLLVLLTCWGRFSGCCVVGSFVLVIGFGGALVFY